MGIYDPTLVDEVPAGDFKFGRHVYEHLQHREGVALTALHSTDSNADAEQAVGAGFELAGHLEFGRDVTLPDGSMDRTKTTLVILPDTAFPRLSFFLCQQHRPELIYVPEWLEHPNQVNGIGGVNIVASVQYQELLATRFEQLYSGCNPLEGGFECNTANGMLRVFTTSAFEEHIAPIPTPAQGETLPFIAGMDFVMADSDALLDWLNNSGTPYLTIPNGFVLTEPTLTANTVFRFINYD